MNHPKNTRTEHVIQNFQNFLQTAFGWFYGVVSNFPSNFAGKDKIQGMILAEKVAKVEFERIRKEKEDERKRLLELRAKKAQEAKNAKKGGKDAGFRDRCFG